MSNIRNFAIMPITFVVPSVYQRLLVLCQKYEYEY